MATGRTPAYLSGPDLASPLRIYFDHEIMTVVEPCFVKLGGLARVTRRWHVREFLPKILVWILPRCYIANKKRLPVDAEKRPLSSTST
jgi:hypothetical protein